MPIFFTILVTLLATASQVHAGVFNSVHFVEPGAFAIGLEPDLTLSNATGAAIAVNLRFTHALSDSNDLNVIIGTGDGPRRFRLGGNVTFDVFPSTEDQLGLGFAAQGIYYSLVDGTQLDFSLIPYLHKSFGSAQTEIEPYFAFPFGMAFINGRYEAHSALSLGAIFKASENFRYVFEMGIAVNHADSYMAGGIAYYH